MLFEITEFDKDYLGVTAMFFQYFSNEEEVEKYCREQDQSGYNYFYKLVKENVK